MEKALTGLKVLDLSRLLTGPVCTMHLADLGADVIKVEMPGRGDDARAFGPFQQGESGYFISINRNKRGMTLDLRQPAGKEVLLKLVAWADVLLENFTVGTMEKWGLGYEELKKINPRLIYTSITGFGQFGPYAHQVAFDAIAQAMGGLMYITGYPGTPPVRVAPALGDINAGNFAAIAMLAALYQRERTGQGQCIDISMQDCIFAILENALVRYTMGGEVPDRLGSRHPSVAPYDVYPVADGHVIIACANTATWERLAKAMEQEELIQDSRFLTNQNRVENYAELLNIISRWTEKQPAEEVLALLRKNAVPVAPIFSMADLDRDEHVAARRMIVETEHPVVGKVRIPGIPFKMSASPDTVEQCAPTLGQHTREILSELGYSGEEIDKLHENHII